jgi:hypothetical protein
MSQKQKPNLAAALAEVGGSTRRKPSMPLRAAAPAARAARKRAEEKKPEAVPAEESDGVYQAPSRAGTAPITGHFPKEVRDQLKILAIEKNSTLHKLMAEAYNDLFAKYGKPEIAPHQAMVEK